MPELEVSIFLTLPEDIDAGCKLGSSNMLAGVVSSETIRVSVPVQVQKGRVLVGRKVKNILGSSCGPNRD
jgi:hypothetical protein